MGLEETDAWILHKKLIGDSSYYVTFFTRQKGIIIALCRGAAKSSKKQSLLQQFNPLWVSFNEKLNKFYVNKIELQGVGLNFTKNSLFASLYVNELLYNLIKPEDEYACLFDAYVDVLRGLQDFPEQNYIDGFLRSFELKLLQAIGYGFTLTIDVNINRQVKPDLYYQFLPYKGIVAAQKGILGEHLLAIDKYDFSDKNVLKSAKIITYAAIDYCMAGKNLKSRDFLNLSTRAATD